MKIEQTEQKNELKELSNSSAVSYKDGKAIPIDDSQYLIKAKIDMPKMLKNMEQEDQEKLIDWIIEKINESQNISTINLKKENYTLEDLKQNLINELNTQINNNGDLSVFNKEIELLKIILENEKD